MYEKLYAFGCHCKMQLTPTGLHNLFTPTSQMCNKSMSPQFAVRKLFSVATRTPWNVFIATVVG